VSVGPGVGAIPCGDSAELAKPSTGNLDPMSTRLCVDNEQVAHFGDHPEGHLPKTGGGLINHLAHCRQAGMSPSKSPGVVNFPGGENDCDGNDFDGNEINGTGNVRTDWTLEPDD